MNLEQRARKFATEAHEGQVRKYTGEPYINHPHAVVELVRSVPYTEGMLAAAWLHDVVEDTEIQAWEVYATFGLQVGLLVEMLTDVSKPKDGNRKERKAIDLRHTSMASRHAQTVKLADLIDNSDSILRYDPGFAKVYLGEKQALLKVLTAGDLTLWSRANCIVTHYFSTKGKRK